MRSWSSPHVLPCAAVVLILTSAPDVAAQRFNGGGFGRAPGDGGFRGGGGGGAGLGMGLGLGLGAAMLGGAGRLPPRMVGGGQPTTTVPPAPRGRSHARHVHTVGAPPRHPPRSVPAVASRPGFTIPAPDERRYVPDEVLLTLKAQVPPDQVRKFEVAYGLTRLATTRVALLDTSVSRYRLREGTSVRPALEALRGSPSFVTAAQPNFVFSLQEEGAAAAMQDASRNPGALAPPTQADRSVQYAADVLKLGAAHRVATGAHVLIAIIDTGIDETHPEISGMVADRFDAVGGRFTPHAHGTAMAGVIVAHQGLVGIAPDAHVIAIRAFASLPSGGTSGTSFDILRGLDFAALHEARIINMSFAGPEDPLLRDALAAARRRGIVAIAAAGNGGPHAKPLYPAAEHGVIAVTATDAKNRLFAQANRGPYVAIAAPGVDVLVPGLGGGLQLTSGTSIATAEASGVAALLIQGNGTVAPDVIRKRLCDTAHRLPDGASAGAGLIDAAAAVGAKEGADPPLNRRP